MSKVIKIKTYNFEKEFEHIIPKDAKNVVITPVYAQIVDGYLVSFQEETEVGHEDR